VSVLRTASRLQLQAVLSLASATAAASLAGPVHARKTWVGCASLAVYQLLVPCSCCSRYVLMQYVCPAFLCRPLEGVREWLDTLGRFNVPCALVSALDRSTVQAALARMTLHDHFQTMVTAEDELETISQRLLTASVKLGRAPNMCVYFDSSPPGITAAHNVTFKAVAVQVRIVAVHWREVRTLAECSSMQMNTSGAHSWDRSQQMHCNHGAGLATALRPCLYCLPDLLLQTLLLQPDSPSCRLRSVASFVFPCIVRRASTAPTS
jgi:phosphoglycolate phosphatase-like HAD superfamily hydrolase